MGEGDEDVAEDDGGVGVDCGGDDGHDGIPAPPKERGRGSPFNPVCINFYARLKLLSLLPSNT